MTIKRISGFVLGLILVCTLLYGQFLRSPIVFDDLPFFTVNVNDRQPVDDLHFSLLELRSLPYATLAWGKAAFGLDMLHFRVENLLLHAFVAIALFFFLARLFNAIPLRAVGRLRSDTLAFFAALLFALHPVAVYATAYLVQRSILMATLFGLLAMLAYLHGSDKDSRHWLWTSVLLYYFALLCKEHVIILPAVLMALTVLLHENWLSKLRKWWEIHAALLAVALVVLIMKFGIIGSVYEPGAPEMLVDSESNLNLPLSILTQSWMFFKYALLWLFPNPNWMSVDMREPFATSLWSGYLVAFCAYILWGALSLWLLFKRGRFGLLGFSLLFPWLMFMTEFSTIRIQESFVLYRSYLWAVGACAVLPLLLDRLDKHMAGIVAGAVALAMFPISMDRLATFSHPLLLWDDAAKLLPQENPLPGSSRIYNNRGLEFMDMNNFSAAKQDFEHCLQLNPNTPSAHTNLGAMYLKMGQPQQAQLAFDRAIAIMQAAGKVNYANPFYGNGKAYEALSQAKKARENYAISCRLARKGCEKLTEEVGGSDMQ